jgi:hypothetical protein
MLLLSRSELAAREVASSPQFQLHDFCCIYFLASWLYFLGMHYAKGLPYLYYVMLSIGGIIIRVTDYVGILPQRVFQLSSDDLYSDSSLVQGLIRVSF